MTLKWQNLDIGDEPLEWFHPASGPDVLPTGVNADFQHLSTGKFAIEFDVDEAGSMVVRAEGTGACKCASERKFKVTESSLIVVEA